jgi:hypothetical protein
MNTVQIGNGESLRERHSLSVRGEHRLYTRCGDARRACVTLVIYVEITAVGRVKV